MTITLSEQFFVAPSSRFLSALSVFVWRVREQSQQLRSLKVDRAAFMNLVHQGDRILDDIGVTREEVLWAASLPLETNAALALQERAKLRRRAVVQVGSEANDKGLCVEVAQRKRFQVSICE